MAYNGKTNWTNNEIVEASDLNRIEQGVADNDAALQNKVDKEAGKGLMSAADKTLLGVHDAKIADLAGKQKTITSGTADPSGGVDGDIYLKIIS